MQQKAQLVVVGAGFSGAVLAHHLAVAGFKVSVYDQRLHVAGNCHTCRDEQTGILVHKYGPHIFHTDNQTTWDFIDRFGGLQRYNHAVFVNQNSRIFRLPINLHTINQFFDKAMSPAQAEEFLAKKLIQNDTPVNFEEQALALIGEELYEAFIKNYTIKQWGTDPKYLPAHLILRLPVRYNFDDNYFKHSLQGIPSNGYTKIVENLLNHPNIHVTLGNKFYSHQVANYDHAFVTAPIDEWYNFCEGRLNYRTLVFEEIRMLGDFQGCPVMNYSDLSVPFTRITEHKHFAPHENFDNTIIYKEYSRQCGKHDIPFYPTRLEGDKHILRKYIERADADSKVSFLGRLGTYRYIDMDAAVEEAAESARQFIRLKQSNQSIPAFFKRPL